MPGQLEIDEISNTCQFSAHNHDTEIVLYVITSVAVQGFTVDFILLSKICSEDAPMVFLLERMACVTASVS